MKRTKLIVSLAAVTALLAACSSSPPNEPGKVFTTKDGSTVRLGAITVNGTNVPLTEIQVR